MRAAHDSGAVYVRDTSRSFTKPAFSKKPVSSPRNASASAAAWAASEVPGRVNPWQVADRQRKASVLLSGLLAQRPVSNPYSRELTRKLTPEQNDPPRGAT